MNIDIIPTVTFPPNPISNNRRKPVYYYLFKSPLYDRHNRPPLSPFRNISKFNQLTSNTNNPSISQCVNELNHALNSKMRFWCFYEWYYATIDRDYFRRDEFKNYLKSKGLDDVLII